MSQPALALRLSRIVLRILIPSNLVMGALITILLLVSLPYPGANAESWIMQALGAKDIGMLQGMRVIMVIGICAVPLSHVILTRLLAIVHSVYDNDPFVAENAARLLAIAWALLGLEVTHLIVRAVADAVSTAAAQQIDLGHSFTGWIAALLLFVLAQVFAQGTRMRNDLEKVI